MDTADIVDVWWVDLSSPRWQHPDQLEILSADERTRAERFRFAVHQERFCAARIALRSILASYLDRDPVDLRFETGVHGKPRLAASNAGGRVEFNLSHSGGIGVVALSPSRAVGIDVEHVRALTDLEGLTGLCLAPREAAMINEAPDAARFPLFFRCWTRKEAFTKACGEGLHMSLTSVDVDPAAPGPVTLEYPVNVNHPSRWTVVDLQSPDDFASALAVEGDACRLRCQWWHACA